MKEYQGILIKHLAFVIIALLLLILACIVLIVVTKKMQLEKSLYCISAIVIVIALVFGGMHIINCCLDLHYNSFETYSGKCSAPSRDTLVLGDEKSTRLTALVSAPSGENNLCVVYSKRSKLVLNVEIIE